MRLFRYPQASVLRHDSAALGTEAVYDNTVLRHYAFANEWFKVNITTDRAGRFLEAPTTTDVPAFAFNCDIAIPMLRSGGAVHAAVHAVDLSADVLVRADGTTFATVDRAGLDAARAHGLISAREHRFGVEGLARLIDLIQRHALVSFLNEICPFGPTSALPALPMAVAPLADVPLLRPGQRPT